MQVQLNRFRAAWSGLPRRAQLAIAGVAIATIVILFLVFRAASAVTYESVTGPDVHGDKLGKAQTALEEAGFDAKLSADKSAVEVPAEDAAKAENVLANEGISGRVKCAGKEGMVSATSKEFARDERECLQDRLASYVESQAGVQPGSAQVLLKMQDDDFFRDEAAPATASVSYSTDDSRLSNKNVKAIQATVAGAVAGLKADDVVVTDNTLGRVVSGEGDDADGPANKIDSEQRFNSMVEAKWKEFGEDIVGTDRIKVVSNVELDMDEINRVVHAVGGPNGEQGPVSAEDVADEVLNGAAGAAVEGVVGTTPNLVDPTDNRTVTTDPTGAAADEGDYLSKAGKITYDNPFTNEEIEVAIGNVVRHRMVVIVDDDVDPAAANAVRDAMKAWMGGNAEDSLSFSQAPLAIAEREAADITGASRTEAIVSYIKWALLGLALLALAFVLRRALTQRTAELLNPADDLLLLEPGFEPIPLAELEAALAAGSQVEGSARRDLHRKVEEIAEAKPQDVANELRRWMQQDDVTYATTPARR